MPGDGRYAIVNNAGGSTVSVVDIAGGSVVQTIEVGARFLLTYGAGHKGPFLRELRKRDDIVLLEVATFLDGLAGR